MNDTIQLGTQAQTPVTAAQSGAGAFFGASSPASNTLFANLLLQQMSAASPSSSNPLDASSDAAGTGLFGQDSSGLPGLDMTSLFLKNPDAQNLDLQNLGLQNLSLQNLVPQNLGPQNLGLQNLGLQNFDIQGLLRSGKMPGLLPLLNALKAQLRSKAVLPGNANQVPSSSADGQTSVPDAVLASWLAALSAQQSQPDLKNLKIDLSLGGAQPLGGGANGANVDPRVLRAIEQMISRLEQPGTTGQQVSQPALGMPEKIVPATKDNVPVLADPVSKVVPDPKNDKNSFATLVQAAGGNPRVEKPVLNIDAKVDAKPDSIFNIKPAGNDVQPSVVPAAPLDHAPDANSQGQTSSQPQTDSKNSGGGESRKGNAAADQFQSLVSDTQASGNSAGAHQDQSGLNTVLQSAHANTGNGSPVPLATTNDESAPSVRDVVANTSHLDPTTPRVVNEAQLMQAAGQAEMHVSLKSETAGSVDVRAMLEGNHISATIAAQHSSTREWLTANLGELQSTLSRDDLHLRNIEVTDSSLQNDPRNASSGQQDAQQQQQFMRPHIQREFQQTAGLTDDLDLSQSETATQALSLHA